MRLEETMRKPSHALTDYIPLNDAVRFYPRET